LALSDRHHLRERSDLGVQEATPDAPPAKPYHVWIPPAGQAAEPSDIEADDDGGVIVHVSDDDGPWLKKNDDGSVIVVVPD
jgi:hypothetical protein